MAEEDKGGVLSVGNVEVTGRPSFDGKVTVSGLSTFLGSTLAVEAQEKKSPVTRQAAAKTFNNFIKTPCRLSGLFFAFSPSSACKEIMTHVKAKKNCRLAKVIGKSAILRDTLGLKN